MAKWLRNEFDKCLTYEKLMDAHNLAKRGKGFRKEVILFELKKEEYIKWLYEQLKYGKYEHGGYTAFYVTEPKLRKVEKSRYIDRLVHTWVVKKFLEPHFVPKFIEHSYACLKNKGVHKSAIYIQNCMKQAKMKWGEYYILKMDVSKYFASINKEILVGILKRTIKDEKVLWILKKIIYSGEKEVGIEIRKLYFSDVCQYLS